MIWGYLHIFTVELQETVTNSRCFASRQTIIHINAILTIKRLDNARLSIPLKEPDGKLEMIGAGDKSMALKNGGTGYFVLPATVEPSAAYIAFR